MLKKDGGRMMHGHILLFGGGVERGGMVRWGGRGRRGRGEERPMAKSVSHQVLWLPSQSSQLSLHAAHCLQ